MIMLLPLQQRRAEALLVLLVVVLLVQRVGTSCSATTELAVYASASHADLLLPLLRI